MEKQKFGFSALILVCVLLGFGCNGPVITSKVLPTDAHPSLKCEKSKAEYWDPKTGACLKVETMEQAFRLNEIRYLSQLDLEEKEKVEADIVLYESEDLASFCGFISELPKVWSIKTLIAETRPDDDNAVEGRTYHVNQLISGLDCRTLTDKIKREFQNQSVRDELVYWYVTVEANPAELREWWIAHWQEIRLVMPRVVALDFTVNPPCPTCELSGIK